MSDDDVLTRVFGPDLSVEFSPLNPAKVIPAHTCEWVETRTWGVIWVACPVCKSQRPEAMTRGTT